MYKTGNDRGQIRLFNLDEEIDQDDPVRFIDSFVDSFDISKFEKAEPKNTGRRPYNPRDLLKMYIYGLELNLQSSRKLERACRYDLAMRWLMNELTPESTTICNFRRENAEQLEELFNNFCKMLIEKGYADGEILAIDGTKIRANNSKRNNHSLNGIEQKLKYAREKVAKYLNDIENADKLEYFKEKEAKLEQMHEELKASGENQLSTTDSDARLMGKKYDTKEVAYNIQSVVDSKHNLVVGIDISTSSADAGSLDKVLKKTKKILGLTTFTALADAGYHFGAGIRSCEEANIVTIIPSTVNQNDKTVTIINPETKKKEDIVLYGLKRFTYNKEENVYICPCGKKLYPPKKSSSETKNFFYGNAKACKNCPNKHLCTRAKEGRRIQRTETSEYVEENDKRYNANPELYALRQQMVEHPFGTIKRTMGIRQFLTRGIKMVKGELALIFLCYNLKRLRVIHNN